MEIPENSVVFKRNVGIGGGSPCDPLRLVQYDETLPVLAATLWVGGVQYIPPDGAAIHIRWYKPDAHGVYNPALGVGDDGTVYIQITQAMTSAAGTGYGNIEVVVDGGVKCSDPIPAQISRNAVQEGAIVSTDEFKTLDQILAEVQALQEEVEADASAASTDAQRAETAREATETVAETVKQIVAGNEAWTKQESNDRFALALETDTGKGTSHEIYPDPGSPVVVTAYGNTEQDGSGDPSPDNVRKLNPMESVVVSVGEDSFSPSLTEPIWEGDTVVSSKDGQCVETHNMIAYKMTGDERSYTEDSLLFLPGVGSQDTFYSADYISVQCSHAIGKKKSVLDDPELSVAVATGYIRFSAGFKNRFGGQNGVRQYLKEQFQAGSPVTILFNRNDTKAKAKIYTHAPFPLIAKPDATGKVTVSGEKQVSAVYNKSIKRAIDEINAAILQLGGSQDV